MRRAIAISLRRFAPVPAARTRQHHRAGPRSGGANRFRRVTICGTVRAALPFIVVLVTVVPASVIGLEGVCG
jgi:hypothetical protein